MNWGVKVLQTSALPLGYGAEYKGRSHIQMQRPVGADDEARTRYLHLGKVALYQMSYIRKPILQKLLYRTPPLLSSPMVNYFLSSERCHPVETYAIIGEQSTARPEARVSGSFLERLGSLMSYSINLGSWQSIFAVPSDVVDKHLKLAGGAQLKVLLWVLRHAGSPFEAEAVGEALNMHPADVKDAMQYWVETGLLAVSGGTFSPAQTGPGRSSREEAVPAAQPAAPQGSPVSSIAQGENRPTAVTQRASEPPKASRPLSRPQKPDSLFVAKRAQEDSDIAFLLQEAQVILGKTISNGDSATLLMLHDTDGLPVDVILMLLQYASSIGKGNMRYIEKTGIRWSDEGIDSLELAERKIRQLDQSQRPGRQSSGFWVWSADPPPLRKLSSRAAGLTNGVSQRI